MSNNNKKENSNNKARHKWFVWQEKRLHIEREGEIRETEKDRKRERDTDRDKYREKNTERDRARERVRTSQSAHCNGHRQKLSSKTVDSCCPITIKLMS